MLKNPAIISKHSKAFIEIMLQISLKYKVTIKVIVKFITITEKI